MLLYGVRLNADLYYFDRHTNLLGMHTCYSTPSALNTASTGSA